jgi:hypothetical protein
MTYQEKLRAVVAKLDSDGADSEEEWAASILKAIGINTPDNPTGQEPDGPTNDPIYEASLKSPLLVRPIQDDPGARSGMIVQGQCCPP